MNLEIEDSVLENFRSKYPGVHPLVFHRSVEKASSLLDLFEILEGVPGEPPFSWDDSSRSWCRDEDFMAAGAMKSMRKRKN